MVYLQEQCSTKEAHSQKMQQWFPWARYAGDWKPSFIKHGWGICGPLDFAGLQLSYTSCYCCKFLKPLFNVSTTHVSKPFVRMPIHTGPIHNVQIGSKWRKHAFAFVMWPGAPEKKISKMRKMFYNTTMHCKGNRSKVNMIAHRS